MTYQFEPVNLPPLSQRPSDPDVIAPDGSEIRLLIDNRHFAVGASMVEVTLGAGQVSRPVYHQTVEEVWYVLEGGGQVWRCPSDAKEPSQVPAVAVTAGDSLVIPTGWAFQFCADDDAELRFLCFTLPPWPGDDEAQPAEYSGLGEPTV